jgi:outer membrane protein assembly factor BamA
MSNPIPLGFYFGIPLEKGDGDRTETLSFSLSTLN